MTDPIRVNGNLYSWGSLTIVVDGAIVTGFNEISFSDKRERVLGYGLGSHHAPLGRSAGKYSAEEVTLKGFKHAIANLRATLAQVAEDGRSYGNVEFDIDVYGVEPALGSVSANLKGCVIVGDSDSYSEGADPLMGELKIQCMYIMRDGTTLFDSSQVQP